MIITCEECQARYLINPDVLGASGRIVRCSSCAHSWHQNPPEDRPRPLGGDFYEEKEPSFDFDKDDDVPGLDTDLSKMTSDLAFASQSLFYPPQKKRFSIVKVMGIFLGFFLLLVLTVGYVGRDQILSRFPKLEPLYAAVGVDMNLLALGLELKDVTWVVADPALKKVLLKGVIVNTSRRALVIPPLSLLLKGTQGEDYVALDRWVVHTPMNKILPGEVYPFQIPLTDDIPGEVEEIEVDFVHP